MFDHMPSLLFNPLASCDLAKPSTTPHLNVDSTRLNISPIGYAPCSVQSPRNPHRAQNTDARSILTQRGDECPSYERSSGPAKPSTDYEQIVIPQPPRPHPISQRTDVRIPPFSSPPQDHSQVPTSHPCQHLHACQGQKASPPSSSTLLASLGLPNARRNLLKGPQAVNLHRTERPDISLSTRAPIPEMVVHAIVHSCGSR
ncbi:hypothetical protein FA13DRAFT_1177351 [Coprinellus micaceus]|uniref:Uncharacterized protein n=1 Tax=Coprinellus micaceus TaxID=71717 RepID=A0A4Y7SUH1_COPMI|nr:hypothetical protein FA13DRAFT_1177351 [Coprinellus micaceus]